MAKLATIIFATFLVCMTVVGTKAQVLSCGTVVSTLRPCLTYLRDGGAVPRGCCDGVKSLNNAANSPEKRKDACRCMKAAAKTSGVNSHYAAALPRKCKVNVGYAINFHVDCNTVH